MVIYKKVNIFVNSKQRSKRMKNGKIIYSNKDAKSQALLHVILTPPHICKIVYNQEFSAEGVIPGLIWRYNMAY